MAGKKITELNSGSLSNLPLSGVTAVVYSGLTLQHSLSDLRLKLVDSGSHHFTGSQHFNGDLTITGSIKSLIVGTGSFHIDNPEILHVQNSGSYNIAHFESNNEYYAQVNIKNTSSGSNSSTDLVLTADNGTEGVHFIDLGINSSTYTGGLVGRENDAYLLNVGKDMYIGTVGGAEHPSKLFLFGQNNWENPQITVSGSGQVSFNTCSCDPGYTYQFSGSAKMQNELNVDGSITASHFVGDGSQLTNLPIQTTDVSMFLSSSTFTSASASFDSRIIAATNEQDLSYFATTGSNVFSGNQTISGSLVVSEIVSTTAPAVGDIASASETGINYLTGELTKWAIFREDAFTIGVWTDVQPGWTVTDNNGFTDIIAGRGSFGAASFQTTVNNWPSPASGKTYVFTAPDYQPESVNPLEVTVGDNDWVFGVNGGLTFPDETIQTTAYIPAILVTTESFNSFSSSINTTTASLNTFSASVNGKTGSFATTGSNTFVGDQTITGSLNATSITGSILATNGLISGSAQLTSVFPEKIIGSWLVPTGTSIQSFTVEVGHTYSMWVNGNIPNGIITWNATVTTSNTNVPVIGSQYGWYYVDGNALVLTSIPDQIVGTNGGIISSPSSYGLNTSNVFSFGITNNSGTTQIINYGYIKIS
jgi:hypothetical protein